MHGWMRKLKSKTSAFLQCKEASQDDYTSRVTNEAASVERLSPSSNLVVSSSSSSLLSLSSSSALNIPASSSKAHLPVTTTLSSAARWSRKYDVVVCHSSVERDIEEATRLVAFLEVAPRCFRCFLWHRDSIPGAAIATELSRAIQDSHCKALLITPHFIQEGWCKYMVQQSLAAGPMSDRTIPLIQNLPHDQYPKVLQSVFYVDLSTNPDRGYKLVCSSVLKVLHDMVNTEKIVEVDRTRFDEDK
ncbi:unnamed protein product [Lota lota]